MKRVLAWLQMQNLMVRPASRASYDTNGTILAGVYPVNGGRCNAIGDWVQDSALYDATLKAAVHAAGQLYMPTVWIENAAAFQTVLDNPALSARAINNLVVLATERGYDGPWDGVDFDIETVADEYKDKLTAWFDAAIAALHAEGLKANITAMAAFQDSGQPGGRHVFDFASLGDIADTITVMLYTSSGMFPNTAPGALDFDRRVLDYILGKGVDSRTLYAGLGVTSRYVKDGVGAHVSYGYGQDVLSAAGVDTHWYELGDDGRRFSLHRAAWDTNEMWVVNEDTLRVHLNLIGEYGLAGACLFLLGSEDLAIWPIIAEWQAGTAPWHGYAVFENVGLSVRDWTTFVDYTKVQGQWHNQQPNRLNHWRIVSPSAIIIEAEWGHGELGIEHCKDWLGAILGIDGTDLALDDYVSLQILGGFGATWEQSRIEALAYLAGKRAS